VTEHLNYINGEWVAGSGFTPNINPSDLADTIGLYAKGTAAQVDDAVRAARAAVPAWQAFGIQARADALEKIGLEILGPQGRNSAPCSRGRKARPEPKPSAKLRVRATSSSSSPASVFARRANCCLRCGRTSAWKSRANRWAWWASSALELPHRDSGVEDRARPRLRQLRGHQARRSGARAAPGRWQTSSRAPACRPERSTS